MRINAFLDEVTVRKTRGSVQMMSRTSAEGFQSISNCFSSRSRIILGCPSSQSFTSFLFLTDSWSLPTYTRHPRTPDRVSHLSTSVLRICMDILILQINTWSCVQFVCYFEISSPLPPYPPIFSLNGSGGPSHRLPTCFLLLPRVKSTAPAASPGRVRPAVAGRCRPAVALVERFDIEPFPDFSAK